jgi:hypothetical protein
VDVALDRESEYPTQVDALGSGWGDASDELGRDKAAATLRPMIEDLLHLGGVPDPPLRSSPSPR